MILKLFIAFSSLIFVSYGQTSVVDFCVADYTIAKGPAGYSCKNTSKVTTDDFIFSGLDVKGNTSNLFKFAANGAYDLTLPGLNGLWLSLFRLDIDVGGAVPIHTHRVSEVIIVMEGTIIAGFIDSNNTAYFKTLNKGDVMVFPQSLLHFQVNVGNTPALAFVSLNSPNPGFQFISNSLFANNLPSSIVEKITLIDEDQVKKLKSIFGGTN